MKMTKTKKYLKAATEQAMTRARTAGKSAARQIVAAADAVLVEAGHAAKRRQRNRAVKAALKVAGKAAVIAGAAAATVVAVRAVRARKTVA
jgi:hypothetical protein